MGGHIDCYLDCTSYFSYFALLYLLKNRALLEAHNVTTEFHPIFLSGIMGASGNTPPWYVPSKARYGHFDTARTAKYHGVQKITTPDFFPANTILPQRALSYIKVTFPSTTFESTFLALFESMWLSHINITFPAQLTRVLESTKLFTPEEIRNVLKAATEKEWKDALTATTKKVLDQGAFGAPWMWVRNRKGKEEPFFGSDRFHFMYEFLGVPWQDIAILPPKDGIGAAKL